jgi:hypothetical protein
MRKIFGPKRDKVTGEWRRLNNEELYDLYYSPNIIRVFKLGRIRWEGHVERMGREEAHTEFWWGNLNEGDHLKDLGEAGRILLKWIFKV